MTKKEIEKLEISIGKGMVKTKAVIEDKDGDRRIYYNKISKCYYTLFQPMGIWVKLNDEKQNELITFLRKKNIEKFLNEECQ